MNTLSKLVLTGFSLFAIAKLTKKQESLGLNGPKKKSTKKRSVAIRLPDYKSGAKNEVFFSFNNDFKNFEELINTAKMFWLGGDGVGGYNYKKTDKIALGYVDLSKKYNSSISKSFKAYRYVNFERIMK